MSLTEHSGGQAGSSIVNTDDPRTVQVIKVHISMGTAELLGNGVATVNPI